LQICNSRSASVERESLRQAPCSGSRTWSVGNSRYMINGRIN
jgi:hypothetical protein